MSLTYVNFVEFVTVLSPKEAYSYVRGSESSGATNLKSDSREDSRVEVLRPI